MATTFKKVSNNGQTTLLNSINNSVTSLQIQVAHTGRFPASGNFWINIYNSSTPSTFETMLVTAVASNTWTVTRAQDSTAAASWTAGDVIELPIRKEHIEELDTAVNTLENAGYITASSTDTLTNKTATNFVLTGAGAGKATLTYANSASNSTVTVPSEGGSAVSLISGGATQTLTNKTIGTTNLISFNSPDNFVINGKINVAVASNNITLSLVGLNGSAPSSTNPVYISIGGNIRTVTAALSVTKNAGTNWFGSGATGLATQEIDYFAYIGYNATDGVVIGFARFPAATQYSDFSTTTTNEKYCAISTITTAASSDPYIVIGRFAATLSATASFNWSVPTFTPSNLIQRPIYRTRALTHTPTSTGFSGSPTNSCTYWIVENEMRAIFSTSAATSNATTFTLTVPFAAVGQGTFVVRVLDNGTWGAGLCAWTTNLTLYKDVGANAFTSSGSKGLDNANVSVRIAT